MAKTLLKMVQDILDSLDGEPVNSIGDTVESRQIVTFIRNSFEELLAGLHLPSLKVPFELQPSNDPTLPVVMYLPDTALNMDWMKYNKDGINQTVGFQDVNYQPLETFIQSMFGFTYPSPEYQTGVLTIPTGTFPIFFRNNKPPDYYTVIADKILVFDSYDNQVDTTLQGNKSMGYGEQRVVFIEEDDYIPPLSEHEFTLLENEAKSQAFIEQKQTDNPIAEKRARKGWIRSQTTKISVPNYLNAKLRSGTNFGRRGAYGIAKYLRSGQ